MPRNILNVGIVANDGTGDDFRVAGQKINDNFEELYAETGVDTQIEFDGNNIISTLSNADINIIPSGSGVIRLPALRFNGNNIEAIRSNDNINLIGSGLGGVALSQVVFTQNDISVAGNNSDINLTPSGIGQVAIDNLEVDNQINIVGTRIDAVASNSDIVLSASGTGQVKIGSVSLNHNTIKTNISNEDLELTASGSGTVKLNEFNLPSTDGTTNQFLTTDGNKNLSFSTPSLTLSLSDINDNSVSNTGSAQFTLDSFDSATFSGAAYTLSISDTTNDRHECVDVGVIHDGSVAYVNDNASVTNYTGSLLTLDADISGGNVRLLATPISNDSITIKFIRRIFDA
jgi:hypothetical protein